MKAKEYLSQAFRLDERINTKLEQAEYVKALSMKTTSCFGSEKISGGKTRSPIENAVCKLLMLEDEINSDIDQLIGLKLEIQTTISKIDSRLYRLILEQRYLEGKKWVEISSILEYDLRWIYRLHVKALKEIDKVIASRHLKDTWI
ncbi:MAG: DUF1492 domain-containing protein [Eubacteriaceae bacterium]|nr:DUF1492 domain-containing protein [Eubacteriaceae bacterium]